MYNVHPGRGPCGSNDGIQSRYSSKPRNEEIQKLSSTLYIKFFSKGNLQGLDEELLLKHLK